MRYAALLLALAAAATARADTDRVLHLAVRGALDGAALGQALAHELGTPVALVDATCELPCLAITVDGQGTATVVYAPRTGAPRARTVTLGSNAGQWPLVVTLLAGNVVRDEAQDVLSALPDRRLPRPAGADGPGSVPAPPGDAAPPPDRPARIAIAAAPAAPTDAGPVLHPEAPPPPPEPREHSFFAVGLVPGLSTDLTHIGSVQHQLSVDLLIGVSGGSTGLSFSGIADIERGRVSGVQLGGIAATASQLTGTQLAGVAALSGDVDGVQVAGIAALADRLAGVQIGGVATIARGTSRAQGAGIAAFAGGDAGVQIGGVATVAHGAADTQAAGIAAFASGDIGVQIAGVAAAASGAGVQAAGIASVASHNARVQVSGVTSVARGDTHVQIAGVVNVAHDVSGVQVAPINIARRVDGVQVGVVNIGGSADGFSFGLINIVPGGRYDLETAIDSNRTGTVLFRHGSRRWHNVYGIGGHPVKETGSSNDDVWMYGLGFGPSMTFGDTVVDLEAISWQVNHGPHHQTDLSLLNQLRLSIAHHWGAFAVVVGGALNVYVTDDPSSPLMLERRTSGSEMPKGVTVDTWASAFVGLRI